MPPSQMTHPSGGELYDFFSAEPAHRLSAEDYKRISLHTMSCEECIELGKIIKENEKEWDAILDRPKTPEEEASVEESLAWFRNHLRSQGCTT